MKHGISRIREYYGVPAKRGMIVRYGASDGEDVDCLIVGSDHSGRLRVKMRDFNGGWSKRTCLLHPTWRVTYPANSQLS
jgi:hypothetical protein